MWSHRKLKPDCHLRKTIELCEEVFGSPSCDLEEPPLSFRLYRHDTSSEQESILYEIEQKYIKPIEEVAGYNPKRFLYTWRCDLNEVSHDLVDYLKLTLYTCS
ncbi:unnamed protein product [Protopolystoma xenopodis]|uniref:Uncharacterized protein n=1 Tax=Protopolystoma xenopodis TaxID=117903 RepID=A0A3S5AJU9_9PLAT|nr:unnamed protein product [Protopolystoma xenopodis]